MNNIELLAPAKNADIAIQAILHGADAIYMGASSHGARSSATNSLDDVAKVVDFAHQYYVKVYITVNTIVYDEELKDVEKLITQLYRCGVDALIVQDMGILRLDIPPIALHASTQCDIRTPEKARFLEKVGFSQLVLPREFSIEDIEAVRKVTTVPLESFVHGALCVSYSGDCQASFAVNGRSANRGECGQICRLPYSLYDSEGNLLVKDKHLLSLRDMNRSLRLVEMMEAGISSFKIEGRLKDVDYVKNCVAAYRQLLDQIIAANPEKYVRSSCGQSEISFYPDLNKSFNRGFTEYLDGCDNVGSIDTPKWRGEQIGVVKRIDKRGIIAKLDKPLNNGDGLSYFDYEGNFHGFRLNRIDYDRLIPARPENSLTPGTILYRNRDKMWDDILAGDTARRTIELDLKLGVTTNNLLTLEGKDERGCQAEVSIPLISTDIAKKPQEPTRKSNLEKTGNTIFRVISVTDNAGNRFIPLSLLTDLRRKCIEALEHTHNATYKFEYRLKEDTEVEFPSDSPLTYHDNVANHLSRNFYESHKATVCQPAYEVMKPAAENSTVTVMTTRYCVRRQMGKCLKFPEGKTWRGPLYLKSGAMSFSLEFDCKNCRMKVMYSPDNATVGRVPRHSN